MCQDGAFGGTTDGKDLPMPRRQYVRTIWCCRRSRSRVCVVIPYDRRDKPCDNSLKNTPDPPRIATKIHTTIILRPLRCYYGSLRYQKESFRMITGVLGSSKTPSRIITVRQSITIRSGYGLIKSLHGSPRIDLRVGSGPYVALVWLGLFHHWSPLKHYDGRTDPLRLSRCYYGFATVPDSSKDHPGWPQLFSTVKNMLGDLLIYRITVVREGITMI